MWRLLDTLGALAAGASLAGFFSSAGWPVELASHFRVQYLVVLGLVAAASAIGRRAAAALTFAAIAAVNAAVVAPAYSAAGIASTANRAPLRVLLVNVNTASSAYAEVLGLVRDAAPHVILLEEINEQWLANLSPLSPEFPFSVVEPREDNFGIALFSRLPLEDARVAEIGLAGLPSVTAEVSFEGTAIRLLGTHTLPPVHRPYSSFRNDQLRAIPEFLSTLPKPWIVLGDLNISPWSYEFDRLLEAADLRDSGRGRGLQATWPANFWPLLVPIDHCLHSPELIVTARKTGPGVGSDHYPLIVDLVPRAVEAR